MSITARPSKSLADLAPAAATVYGEAPALQFRTDDGWRDLSYVELAVVVDDLAGGLIARGIALGDRVSILADTRREWTELALAIVSVGAVLVPIYPTNSSDECEWVLADSGARLLFVENAQQLAKIRAVAERLPDLETIMSIDPVDGVEGIDALRHPDGTPTTEITARRDAVSLADHAIIIYTSGTTGRPKGCVLTHGNMMAVADAVAELDLVNGSDRAYLFLPLAHVFAQITQFGALSGGAATTIFGGDTTKIIEELAETQPTYVPSVPRIFEKIYTTVAGQMTSDQLRDAVAVGMAARRAEAQGQALGDEEQATYDFVDAMLFSKVRAIFGGHVKQAISGAAPIAPDILGLFVAAGVPVLEGYGMTESSGVATVNTLDAYKIGSVGKALPGVDVRIADDGEILMRGANVFAGYWQNAEATAETIDADGWLHTGDLGEIDADGFVSITGRKKDIIITAGGKNLTPANLENDLKTSRFISQAVMHGDRRPYPVALITLDVEEITPWADERGLPSDLAVLCEAPEVIELISGILDEANDNYAKVGQIKRFFVLDHDLSVELGELTPTLKVKRNVVNERYAHRFDELYQS